MESALLLRPQHGLAGGPGDGDLAAAIDIRLSAAFDLGRKRELWTAVGENVAWETAEILSVER